MTPFRSTLNSSTMLSAITRTAALACMIWLVGCGEKTLTNVESGNQNQILHIGNGDEPRELDPHLSTGSPEHHVHLALYEGLVYKDPKTLEIQPAIAERWEISEDKRTYTFFIRKNARFSNGDPLTAHDVLWSWKRSIMPNLGSEWAYAKYYIKNAKAYYTGEITDFNLVGMKALDDYTFQVELNHPTAFFLKVIDNAHYFVVHPATVLAHGDMDQAVSNWTRPENWVGSGPFKLAKWAINQEIVTVKNEHYWDAENVKLNGVNFYPISDQQAEIRAFRSGKIHLTYTPQMAIEKIASFRRDDPASLHVTPNYSSYYYEFNTTKAPFDNPKVRRALAMAIDREAIVKHVTKAGEPPSYSIIPSDPNGYQPTQLFKFDPEAARKLLAEAGYSDPSTFPSMEILYNTHDNHRKIALAVQQMLSENLGISVTLLNQEWKVYLNTRKNLEHQFARGGWIADFLEPSNFLDILTSYSGNNHSGWKNAEYDALMAELGRTYEQSDRYALFEKANAMLAEHMPLLPLYMYSDVNVVSTDVKGWYDNVMHYHTYNRVYLEPSVK